MTNAIQTAVSDYSFIELAKVVQTIEVQAGLKQIPDTAVSSFYFGKLGIENLIRRKYQTLNDLIDNTIRIKRFICHSKRPINRPLILIAASQIRTLEGQIGTVKEQIERGVRLSQYQQMAAYVHTDAKELTDDEIPF